MDTQAQNIVWRYILDHLDMSDPSQNFEVYIALEV